MGNTILPVWGCTAYVLLQRDKRWSLGTDYDNPIDLIQARAASALEHASYGQSL